jgi:hypothetical protein
MFKLEALTTEVSGLGAMSRLYPNVCCLKADILSLVQPGLPCRIPPLEFVYRQKGDPKVLTRDAVVGHSSLLPYGKATVNTYVLSASRRGPGWLIRPLATGELAAAYNLPVRLQKSRWLERDLPFLDAILSKVLMAFHGFLG